MALLPSMNLVKAQYRNVYCASISIKFLEEYREQNPSFNPFDFIYFALNQIQNRYGITFQYLKLDFEVYADYYMLLQQMWEYIPYIATYYPQNLIIQLGIVRNTHQCWTQQDANFLYHYIASLLNEYSNKIVAFLGENELEGNTTCPICGQIGGYEAFRGNVQNMIDYAIMLRQTWDSYSNIPFAVTCVAPWHHNATHVYGGFWFNGMDKSTYYNYISQSCEVLAWTIWWNTDGAQYLGVLQNSLNRPVIVAEHNFWNPNDAKGIMDNFGLSDIIAFSWYTLLGSDLQVLYDWACQTHGLYKHSWFPMVKIPTYTNPEGSYFGVLNTWHDLSYQGYQESYWYWANAQAIAYKYVNIPSNYGYDAFEVYANFEAVTKTSDAEVVFMLVAISETQYYEIGARVNTDRTFRLIFKYVNSNNGITEYQTSPYTVNLMNTWFRLTLCHMRSTIYIMINTELEVILYNGNTASKTFLTVWFGDANSDLVGKIYLDHMKIWTSANGNTWNLVFQERFENSLSEWYKSFSPLEQPTFIDTAKWDWFIDYSSIYSAYKIN